MNDLKDIRFYGDKFLKKETTLSRKEKEQVNAIRADSEHFDPLGSYTGGGKEEPVQDADDL